MHPLKTALIAQTLSQIFTYIKVTTTDARVEWLCRKMPLLFALSVINLLLTLVLFFVLLLKR